MVRRKQGKKAEQQKRKTAELATKRAQAKARARDTTMLANWRLHMRIVQKSMCITNASTHSCDIGAGGAFDSPN
jgi:hypothetical protein